jgi:hypothetical protein
MCQNWTECVYRVLLIGSLAIAYTNWRMDTTQLTGTHVSIYAMRLVSAGMWYLGTLWKLPLPGGLPAPGASSTGIAAISRQSAAWPRSWKCVGFGCGERPLGGFGALLMCCFSRVDATAPLWC